MVRIVKIFLSVFRAMAGRLMLSALTGWLSLMAPIWGAERVYLLERQAQGSAPYAFRSLGEIEGARRAAVPETGGHVLVLTSLGRVWGWGQNLHGQLGTGDTAARAGFVEVPRLSEVTAIAAGAQHSVALKSDGTVWAWGANTEGQLGDGSLVNRTRPGMVPGLRDVSMIAAGTLFTVALKGDGSVWAFGSNWNGIAGTDARKLVTEPVRIEGLRGIRAVGVRLGFGYALDEAGRIWIWGRGVENAGGAPRILRDEERASKAVVLSGLLAGAQGGGRLAAEWNTAAGSGKVEAAGGALRVSSGGGERAFAMEAVALDVTAGWAVAVIAGEGPGGTVAVSGGEAGGGAEVLTREGERSGNGRRAAGPAIVQVIIGEKNTFALRQDGTVRAWGDNRRGYLGDGTGLDRHNPVCTVLSGVQAVSSAWGHSLALRQDGTVWSWGESIYGELGDGITTRHVTAVPRLVKVLSGVTAISAVGNHSLALRSDGTVWAWGLNAAGQLGDGTTNDRSIPVQVPGLAGITSIAAGYAHSMARRSDGVVFTWGSNASGVLGDGTRVSRLTPGAVAGFRAATVAAALYQSFAIRSDGTLWGWGSAGGFVPVIVGQGEAITIPTQLTNFTDVAAISSYGWMNLILRANGSVWYFGNSLSERYAGGLGNGTLSQLPLPMGAVGVAAGQEHLAVLLSDGTVRLLGVNDSGQLGRPELTSSATLIAPAQEIGCTYAAPRRPLVQRRVSTGTSHIAVAEEDGTVWAAGRNDNFQVGNGSWGVGQANITQVTGLTGIAATAACGSHTLALGRDGRVWSWGANSSGELGDGTRLGRSSPVLVSGLSSVTQIACGGFHSLALKSDGTVWGWGGNGSGAVGDGSRVARLVPTQAAGLQNVIEIAGGGTGSLALKADGTVWAWGMTLWEIVPIDHPTPVRVEELSEVVSIAMGVTFGMALKHDGTVWTWGDNSANTLGNGLESAMVAGLARVSDLTNVVAISGGSNHAMALEADGTVWTWGANDIGQLGVEVPQGQAQPVLPVKVPQLYGVASVHAGERYSAAWKRDGSLWVWGSNEYGQFGLTTYGSSPTPIASGFQPGYPLAVAPLGAAAIAGDSAVQSFDFRFRAAAVFSSLQWVQMLFAAAADGGGLPYCFLHYDAQGKGLWLYGDGGFFVGPVAAGTPSNVLQNTYCAVNTQATSITGSGANLTAHAQVLFKQAAARKIYLRSQDIYGVDSGWIEQGRWDSTAVSMAVPSVSPKAGSGATQTFTASYQEASGLPASTGGWVQFLIGAASDGGGQPFCYLHYDRAGNGLWMYSGDVGFFLGPVKPGVSSTALDSSACSINTSGTTVQNSAGLLVIAAPVALKAPMAGSKKIFQRSMDALQRDTGWVQTGGWTVP
ncbi:RCC1-like domain-containing protein [Paludibaculum fermentans]|uniref:RCC1-like domain-containing protein n=1 Tax=Paludibaculum fermentans TaxID=1473598 RepID=UPI003EBBEA38